MKAEVGFYYKGKTNYQGKGAPVDAPPDGSVVYVCAVWVADEHEPYAGQMIFQVSNYSQTLPECYLEIEKLIDYYEYINHK